MWQDDYENGIGELDEGRRQCDELRMNLTQLQENFKQMESSNLYQLLLVPNNRQRKKLQEISEN